MSCKWIAKYPSAKVGDLIETPEQARGLFLGSIVTANGHAWQRYVHGWKTVGSTRQMQLDELLESGFTFLPVKVLVAGEHIVHGIDCTCEETTNAD